MYILSFKQGCYYRDYSKNPKWLNHSTRAPGQSAIKTFIKTANRNEIQCMRLRYTYVKKPMKIIGRLLKEYCCMHAFQLNYGKPSDCNKIIRRKFNESQTFEPSRFDRETHGLGCQTRLCLLISWWIRKLWLSWCTRDPPHHQGIAYFWRIFLKSPGLRS